VRRVLATLAAVLLLAACSGDDKPSSVAQSSGATPPPVLATAKPKVVVPSGPAPKELVKNDLIVGTGDYAVPGKVVTVQYVGVHYTNGKQFDASWDSGHPFPFTLGGEDVIAGWDEGVVGMRVGGRRELIIPPDLGYGPNGDGTGVIGPNETLVFVVDLISVGGDPAGVAGNPSTP
jgi:FKBP-type peptidyl-prolyl cis-trans isomerase